MAQRNKAAGIRRLRLVVNRGKCYDGAQLNQRSSEAMDHVQRTLDYCNGRAQCVPPLATKL